jgi:hypothetical protein
MKEISSQEVESLMNRIGPHINKLYDFTSRPIFPKTRKDVCAVKRLTENGSSYGFDTIYIVWRDSEGLSYEHIDDSSYTRDYLQIYEIFEDENDIVVKYGTGGIYGGSAWEEEYRKNKSEINID